MDETSKHPARVILSDLEVSPVSAFTVPLSQAVHIGLGTVTAVCYAGFVLIQPAVIQKRLRLKNLLRFPLFFLVICQSSAALLMQVIAFRLLG